MFSSKGSTPQEAHEANDTDPLDEPLVFFSESDPFTIRDACEGIQIFGGTGSGKTSGSGAYFARAFLQSGFGGLVLCAKPDEVDLWTRYAEQMGRSKDLIVFNEESPHRFNVLAYESERKGKGGGLTENIVGLFQTLSQMTSSGTSGHGGENEAYWRIQFLKLLRNSVELLRLAKMPVTLLDLHKLITTAPVSREELEDEVWQSKTYFYEPFYHATRRHTKGELSESDAHDYTITVNYWRFEFTRLDPKPRSTILGIFTGMADQLLRGTLYQLFNTTTNLTPEETFAGKVIVLDLPLKRFGDVGRYAQAMFKYSWQRSVEQRKVTTNTRPVFIWIDESQLFVNEYDITFQTTARSARVSSVYLTQNLPNYYQKLGGSSGKSPMVDSLLGNLVTKVFHNNTCAQTNRYASELFAMSWRSKNSHSISEQKGETSFSRSYQDALESNVLPGEFAGLAKGGRPFDFLVEGIVHQGGKIFNGSGENSMRTVFSQR